MLAVFLNLLRRVATVNIEQHAWLSLAVNAVLLGYVTIFRYARRLYRVLLIRRTTRP